MKNVKNEGSLFTELTYRGTPIVSDVLSLDKMARLYHDATLISEADKKCESCNKKARFYSFCLGQMISRTCKDHRIE